MRKATTAYKGLGFSCCVCNRLIETKLPNAILECYCGARYSIHDLQEFEPVQYLGRPNPKEPIDLIIAQDKRVD